MALSVNADFGVSSSTASGTTIFTATATGANLSWNSIQSALQAGDNVVVSSGSTGTEAGNITDQSGAQLSFSGTNLNLMIETGSGTGLAGSISIENVTMSGSNSSVNLNAYENVSTELLSGGTSSSPTPLASAVITANVGYIDSYASPERGPVEATPWRCAQVRELALRR